jgi:hypothetical protein
MPTFRRFLQPTLTDLLGLMLLLLMLSVGSHKLFGDADTATHVATGRWIVEHGMIPRTDPFSSSHLGGEWFAHEWLATLVFFGAFAAGGWSGVVWIAALLIAGAHVLLYRHLVGRGDDALVSFSAVVAAASVASVHWLARPHLFTSLLLVIMVVVLENIVRGRVRPGWLAVLPPLAALWANLHGGFLVMFPILACYWGGVVILAWPRSVGGGRSGPAPVAAPGLARSLVGPLALASAACALAVLANPWGYRLPWHLVTFFATRGAALRHTSEFDPPTLGDRAGVTLAVFLALSLLGLGLGVAAAIRTRRERGRSGGRAGGRAPIERAGGRAPIEGVVAPSLHPATVLAFLLTTVMALRTGRDVEIMAVLGAIVIADGVTAWVHQRLGGETRSDLEGLRRREATGGGGLFLGALLLAALLAAAIRFPPAGFDAAQFPVEMVGRLRAAGVRPEGAVLTPDVWGGYLILEWPEARVFVDGRWDMRGDAFFERYADIMLARPGWEGWLRDAGIAWVLVPPDAALAQALEQSREWTRWGSDDVSRVYRRKPESDPPPAVNAGRPGGEAR